ncbi:hypothetical protein [Rugamonas sp.]|uniref:hypothetical protein n=1 Tax=Rugamonas sp. TaxID=1926287 RepID=UPI0025EADC36|nr:hypothetical protein [Rugamonas sp.]
MENEILTELWRIKDKLSARANRVPKTEAELIELKRFEMDLRKTPYVFVPDATHHAFEIQNLRRDRALAIAYLKTAVEGIDDTDARVSALLMFSTVAEAYQDLTVLAVDAGVALNPVYQMLAGQTLPSFREKAEYLAWFDRRLEEFNSRPSTSAA